MMNNADRVKAACLAQLVNVIGPIMTQTGGPAWRQTIFHPFADCARHGRGEVLRLKVETGGFATTAHGEIPNLLATIVHDPQTGAATLFALNRSVTDDLELAVDLRGLAGDLAIQASTQLHDPDLKKINSMAAPDAVSPVTNPSARLEGGRLTATLKRQSWNVVALARG
jgi:alpha-N-arabinofuranosidase